MLTHAVDAFTHELGGTRTGMNRRIILENRLLFKAFADGDEQPRTPALAEGVGPSSRR
jgi:hypothetical protein